MDTGPEPFGALLRQWRERVGLTQEGLAALAKVSAKAVSALERGERQHPYPATVRALADALGLTDAERARLTSAVPRRTRGQEPVPRPAENVPRQLPSPVRDFTGRVADLATLDATLSGSASAAVAITEIDGTPGVGKTTLAVVWAHRVRERFPDGQLYANLRGYAPQPPATPGEVLDAFLRALDVPVGKIPPTLDERAGLFRSLTDGRRMLILLDNASSSEQVRPLLPASASCLVLVTSRHRLTGLAVSIGVRRVALDRLPTADAVALLRTIVGEARVDAEPEAAAELVRLCARLPLAVQLAGQRVAARPGTRIADLLVNLADDAQRLALLSAGSDELTAIRTVFSWSYRSLTEDQARMFRLLGLHPGPDITADAAAALAGIDAARARWLLDDLVDTHLLEAAGERYQLHDLLRSYAGQMVTEGADDAELAIARLVGFYLHAAAAADRQLLPGRPESLTSGAKPPDFSFGFTGYDQAIAWCDAERANLVAVTRTAAQYRMHAAAWQLPDNLWSYFYIRRYLAEWLAACNLGLAAATALADTHARARMHAGLAAANRYLHRYAEAVHHNRTVLTLYRELGDSYGEALALNNLGDAYLGMRSHQTALGHAAQALALFRTLRHQHGIGVALGNVAEAFLGLGQYDEAIRHFDEVRELCARTGHRYGEGRALIHLGEAYLGLLRTEQALDHLVRGRELASAVGDRYGEALAMDTIGTVYEHTGDLPSACRHWQRALEIYDELGEPREAELRAHISALKSGGTAGR